MKLNRWACLICFLYTPHTVNSLVVFLFKNLYVGRGAGGGVTFVCMNKWVKLL